MIRFCASAAGVRPGTLLRTTNPAMAPADGLERICHGPRVRSQASGVHPAPSARAPVADACPKANADRVGPDASARRHAHPPLDTDIVATLVVELEGTIAAQNVALLELGGAWTNSSRGWRRCWRGCRAKCCSAPSSSLKSTISTSGWERWKKAS
jgi:hypothetical protein